MKTIKICYRADFEGPRGALNPLGWRVPGAITVEVRRISARGNWAAFRPGTPHQFEITPQLQADTLMEQTALSFTKQLTSWRMYELTEPNGVAVEVKPEEVYKDKKGRYYQK